MDVSLDISPDDVGCSDYSCYEITSINTHDIQKEIWSVDYSYTWDCGSGCCSDTRHGTACVGDLSDWVKRWILGKLTGYHFQE